MVKQLSVQPTVGPSMASLSEDWCTSGLVCMSWLEIGWREVPTQGAPFLLYLLAGGGLSVWAPFLAAFNSKLDALRKFYLKGIKNMGIKKGGD